MALALIVGKPDLQQLGAMHDSPPDRNRKPERGTERDARRATHRVPTTPTSIRIEFVVATLMCVDHGGRGQIRRGSEYDRIGGVGFARFSGLNICNRKSKL